MVDLEALAVTIKKLSPQERKELDQLVEAAVDRPSLTPQECIEALRRARDELREGISDEEMREIVKVMNGK